MKGIYCYGALWSKTCFRFDVASAANIDENDMHTHIQYKFLLPEESKDTAGVLYEAPTLSCGDRL